MHHARCTCKSCTSVRNYSMLRFDKMLNDETSEAFASQILCDVRELVVDDEQDEEEEAVKKRIKNEKREEEETAERVLVSNTSATNAASSITLREMSALLSPIHRELIELRSEVTKLKSDIETLRRNKEEKVSHEQISKIEHKFFPLSVSPITYDSFKISSLGTSSVEENGEITLLSEVDRMLSGVRRQCA